MPITFDNDRLSIDFIATQYGPRQFPVDLLSSSRYLAEWIREAQVVDDARPLDWQHLRRARAVRQAISDQLRGDASARAAVHFNALAALPRPQLQLRRDRVIRRGGFDAFLGALATDALLLMARPAELSRVRWCSNRDCGRAFLDRSAGAQRQWCAKACRDQSHSRRYRLRQFGLAHSPAILTRQAERTALG